MPLHLLHFSAGWDGHKAFVSRPESSLSEILPGAEAGYFPQPLKYNLAQYTYPEANHLPSVSLAIHSALYIYSFICSLFATSQKVTGSISNKDIEFFKWPVPSSRTVTLTSTQRPASKADKLTAICESIV
jgi:hypothetical protein